MFWENAHSVYAKVVQRLVSREQKVIFANQWKLEAESCPALPIKN